MYPYRGLHKEKVNKITKECPTPGHPKNDKLNYNFGLRLYDFREVKIEKTKEKNIMVALVYLKCFVKEKNKRDIVVKMRQIEKKSS